MLTLLHRILYPSVTTVRNMNADQLRTLFDRYRVQDVEWLGLDYLTAILDRWDEVDPPPQEEP